MGIKDRLLLSAIHMKEANVGLAVKSLFGQGYNGFERNWSPDVFNTLETFYNKSHIELNCMKDYVEAYFLCPSLAAIINRKAQTYINGKTWILQDGGKKDRQVATTQVSKKIKKLFERPNPMQTWEQFESEQYIFIQLFGYSILYIDKPAGFPNYEADALWNIAPNLVRFETDARPYYRKDIKYIQKATLHYGQYKADLPLEYIHIFKDISPALCNPFFPDSRVKSVKMPINNIIGAYESRNMLINARGAIGMITNKTHDSFSSIPLNPEEKKEMHQEFQKTYGLRKGQLGLIIASKDLDWIPMVSKTKDLMLFEEIQDDNNRLSDAYQFPPILLGSMDKGEKASNFQTATRNLYQDATIPESLNLYSQWESVFDATEYGLIIEKDYSHVEVLQPDRKAEAEARLRRNQALQIEFRNNVITLNQWRIFNGDDPTEDGDVYYTDIKEDFKINYNAGMNDTNIDETEVNDNLDSRQNVGDALNVNPDQ